MRFLMLLATLTCPISCVADDVPQMYSVSAKVAKPGDTLEIVGVGLSPTKVDEIYLTDHKFDMRVKVLDQQEKLIKLRVPPFAKPGRMQLLVLTKGAEPKLLEQPLYVLIEAEDTEISQVKKPEKVEPAKTDQAKQ